MDDKVVTKKYENNINAAQAISSTISCGETKVGFPMDDTREGDKGTIVKLLNTLDQHRGDVTFQGELEELKTLENMRRRERHMENVTGLMEELELAQDLGKNYQVFTLGMVD